MAGIVTLKSLPLGTLKSSKDIPYTLDFNQEKRNFPVRYSGRNREAQLVNNILI